MTRAGKVPDAVERDDAFYDAWYRGRVHAVTVPDEHDFVYGSLLRLLLKHVTTGTRFLDYGCGDGVVALFAAARGAEVLGVDFSREAIARASAYADTHAIANARFERVEFNAAGVIDSPFDVVLASEVIEHVTDDVRLIRWMADVLRPGGVCIITTRLSSDPAHRLRMWLHGFDWTDLADGHVRRYDPDGLSKILEDSGFRVVEVTVAEGLIRTFVYKYRMAGRMFRVLSRHGAGRWLMNAADIVAARVFGASQVIIVARKPGT